MHQNPKGLTVVELILTIALTAGLLLVTAQWFRSGSFALQGAISEHQLHIEAATTADLLSRLLAAADPLSIKLSSTAEGPWTQLSFAAGAHHHTFSVSNHQILYVHDESDPKVLTSHVIGLHFALENNSLPTLLHWSMRLGTGKQARETYYSGVQYVGRPVE